MGYFVVNDRCTGCLACVLNCPAAALSFEDRGEHRRLLHNMARCARCGNCWRVCPQGAVEFQHFMMDQWDEVVSLELLRCEVCGSPIYTVPLKGALSSKKAEPMPLCERHKGIKAAAFVARLPKRSAG